jgi:retinol dehydrogenase-12
VKFTVAQIAGDVLLTILRYNISKTIELLLLRELATEMTRSKKEGNVVVSIINPGFVDTAIMRHAGRGFHVMLAGLKRLAARTAEEGGRTLVFAAYGGAETHGRYLDDCTVGKVSPYIVSEDGAQTQKKLWKELSDKLERIEPGVMAHV